MKDNPPAAADTADAGEDGQARHRPGPAVRQQQARPGGQGCFASVPKIANEKIMLWLKEGIVAGDMKLENGWVFTTKTGLYGTNYLQRALVTAIGLGANRPQDAVYPTSEGPNVVESYNGAKKYVMHFAKGELPPVKGFWSLTMYDKDYFFVKNPINRHSISAAAEL